MQEARAGTYSQDEIHKMKASRCWGDTRNPD
jgi:hypothetical protein